MSNFKQKINDSPYARYISAAFMLPLAALLFIGGIWLFVFTALVALLGMNEFYEGFKHVNIKVPKFIGFFSWAVLTVVYVCHFFMGKDFIEFGTAMGLWIFLTGASSLCYSLFSEDHGVYAGPLAGLGAVYIAFMVYNLSLTRLLKDGSRLVWVALIIALASDAGAYFCGKKWGAKTKKMAPALSPNKTMAGFYGGIVCSTVFCLVFGLIFDADKALIFALMGFIGSFFSQAGDLVESAFKRKMGVKDYSDLIPGHGGIMDRTDSIMFTSSFVYFFAVIFLGA